VQDSFAALLAANPDTVGFLEIEGMLSLPVVQRPNDNEFYLDHSFEGAKALEGALFLDGMNRLVPEDDCLIIYGHNMKNHTMFGRLSAYGDINHLRQHPVVHLDTIYENRSYVVFAAFTASMTPGDAHYFDVRNFIFDPDGFDKFVLKLQGRSVFRSPVDVRYGDRLLLLVTCDYTNREGRFILALRQLREDENEGNMFAEALQAEMK
jgi:sortase B